MSDPAEELFSRSVDQVRRGDVRAALGTLLDTLAADPVHEGALEAAARICRMLGSAEDAQLFEDLATDPKSPDALYALGYRMVDQSRPDVGVVMLERSLAAEPRSLSARRELAFARLQAHDFPGCLDALAPLEDDASLAERERLDVLLLQAEAAFYSDRRDKTQRLLSEAEMIPADEDQTQRLDAVHAMLGRSLRWPSLAKLGLREWHFIQHAGVILKTAGGYFEDSSLGGRFDMLALRTDMVAFLLRRLLDLYETFEVSYDTVVPASETAGPLAVALAAQADMTLLEDIDDRGSRSALLVAAGAGEFTPFAAPLSRHQEDLGIFALNLDWDRDAWVCPEVAGVLSRRVLLPWETRYSVDADGREMSEIPGDPRPMETIGDELADTMDHLPDVVAQSRAEFEDAYKPLRSDLVLANDERYPYRRQFTRLSPARALKTDDDE